MLDASASTTNSDQTPPAIGEQWQGGTYIGHTLHENQLAHLIVLPEEFKGNWKNASAWAAKQDAVLPSRIDMLIMLPQRDALKLQRDWYWTSESHADYPEYAWCQTFGTGGQSYDRKSNYGFRARAVRRITIK